MYLPPPPAPAQPVGVVGAQRTTVVGGVGGTGLRLGGRSTIALVLLIYSILVTILFIAAFATRFTDDEILVSFAYWARVISAFVIIPLSVGFYSIYSWSRSTLTFVLIIEVIWLIAHIVVIIELIIEFASCATSVQCAANALCDGTFVGPYTGSSSTFLIVFIVHIIMLLFELVLLYLVFSARGTFRIAPRCYRSGGGAVGGVSYGAAAAYGVPGGVPPGYGYGPVYGAQQTTAAVVGQPGYGQPGYGQPYYDGFVGAALQGNTAKHRRSRKARNQPDGDSVWLPVPGPDGV